MGEKKIVVYTAGFRKAFVAEGVSGFGSNGKTNIESFLNSDKGDRITLENASCYVLEEGIYKPAEHLEGSPTLNTDLISFIYGTSNLVYSKREVHDKGNKVSLLWDFNHSVGSFYSHRIIGEVDIKGSGIPQIKRGASEGELKKFRNDLSRFVETKSSRNFIPFYNPRADSTGAQKELGALFRWLKVNPESLNCMLINNRKHTSSCLGYDIYLGVSSVNFDRVE
jgi:hypothetical protein